LFKKACILATEEIDWISYIWDGDSLYQDESLVQFYDYDNPWLDSFDIIASWLKETDVVLDIGCGTGTLLTYLDRKCKLCYGIDLSSEMLAIARKKSDTIHWIQTNAINFSIDQKFDFIVLSGHSFQTLLDDDQRLALFERIAMHLSTGGKLVFDSRNPLVKEWMTWIPEKSIRYFQYPDLGIIKSWNDFKPLGDNICYQTYYQILHTEKTWAADSIISFPSYDRITSLLSRYGLIIQKVYGDWHLNDFKNDSEEMIFVCTNC
jgi:SAM-dependent methyltransferase